MRVNARHGLPHCGGHCGVPILGPLLDAVPAADQVVSLAALPNHCTLRVHRQGFCTRGPHVDADDTTTHGFILLFK